MHIMAVSLETKKKFKVYGLYDGNRIGLTLAVPLVGPPSVWGEALKQEIRDKSQSSKNRFTVLVEDRTQEFVVGDATPFSFEELRDGRSMLYHALDWSFSMNEIGKVIVDPTLERFMIRAGSEGQRIEKRQDDKGRTVYSVDWSSLHGGHKAVLMCIVGAMMPPLNMNYLEALYGEVGFEEKEPKALRSWKAITSGFDEAETKRWGRIQRR